MPFGCLALRDGRTYNSISDVTDKYEIGQVLRAKEFCELCLAKDRQTDKVFVCKKFLKKDGRKVRKAAKNEIMILKLVNHPNILQLIDTFETRKEYFIIQELATGGDVFDWIQDQGNYTEKDASSVIRQVLEAVAYLHSLNIVHRNLKLENLMYYTENNHNKVVLRDFYLSRFENGPITEPCGTPEYLAPEVVARHRYGRPVDCWAVGVIMFILLSGNPPFYDETEEENTDLHNRIIFCRIVAGDFEFDSPYWDDISPAAKELVCRLMEVDQMLRITAQDALWHEWIAGNGASEKNLKDGVCAQFEKNFAKAKWRKAIRVTTFMQRLKNSESVIDSSAEVKSEEAGEVEEGATQVASNDGGRRVADGGGVTSSGVSLEVMVENRPAGVDQEVEKQEANVILEPSSPPGEKLGTKKAPANEKRKTDDQNKESKITPECTKLLDSSSGLHLDRKQTSASPDPNTKRKMAATIHRPPTAAGSGTQKDESDGSWCQTQLPEAVAESSVGEAVTPAIAPGPGVDASLGVNLRGEASPVLKNRDARKIDRYSAEFNIARASPSIGQACYAIGSSASLGRHATPYSTDIGTVSMGMAGPYGSPYSTLYTRGRGVGMYGTGLHHGAVGSSVTSDWQMDSVIEQIEKQMVAVLEKIEGDMPSLLEQISDCPSEPLRIRSTHASPATSRARTSQHPTETSGTPPPLPTSPRPALPSLPRLTIPPPSYPPPSPPQALVQATEEQLEKGGQRGADYCGHSSGTGMGRGL
ncbi:caM kinase-like vesicle-associated, like [Nerophis lumbriciformis]|uniref:caM kinase-like vesicle-associated, like n=1 Tax=Nerophis lumbriciformis TaxID=546530 RepID=UPI002AE03B1E|nr:caM kinase-like vesicle-associated protein [Nerophis lumbriciformis]XP_061835916.1 caM kinase-like vesicle-associated protein [Nerophis lumbriciformis]XP_061835922.1 caM kinase-like vesicle-associated protein [Nerophis lumbriciformis]